MHTHRRRHFFALCALWLFVGAITACGGSNESTPTATPTQGAVGQTPTAQSAFDEWVAAAKAEVAADSKAEVRLSGITDATLAAYEKALKDEFGIDVTLVNDPKGFSEVPAAYVAEHQAGVQNVPMLFHNGADNASIVGDAGALAEIDWDGIFGSKWPTIKDFNNAVEYPRVRGGCLVESWAAYSIIYNTDALQGDDVPKSWNDLLDPKYAGKVAAFSSGTPISLLQAVWGPEKTFDYAKQLAANGVIFGTGSPDIAAKVASGEAVASFVNYTFAQVQKDQGAPVGWNLPEDGLVYFGQVICVPKAATHPHLAALTAAMAVAASNDVAGPIRDAAVYSVAYPFATWGVLGDALERQGITPQDFTDVGDADTRAKEKVVRDQIAKEAFGTLK